MNDDIYQKQILEWVNRPKCRGDVMKKTYHAEVKNPLCGDIMFLGTNFNDDSLIWDAQGCIICMAAAECFCQHHLLSEKQHIQTMAHNILLDYQDNFFTEPRFKMFGSIKRIPLRIKCVTLVAHTAQKLLQNMNGNG